MDKCREVDAMNIFFFCKIYSCFLHILVKEYYMQLKQLQSTWENQQNYIMGNYFSVSYAIIVQNSDRNVSDIEK